MIVIRLDRRVLYAVLALLVVLLALGVGLFLGRATGGESAAVAPAPQAAAPGAALPQPGAVPQQNPAAQAPPSNVPLVTVEEARQRFGQPGVVFVDARTVEEYKSGRIQGAINMPANDSATKYNELPKDKELILYCA